MKLLIVNVDLLRLAYGASIRNYHLLKALARQHTLLVRENYDGLLFESILLACYRIATRMKVIIDQHDTVHKLLERTNEQEKTPLSTWYNWQISRLINQIQIERCRKVSVVLVAIEPERLTLEERERKFVC